jgi:UPF0755 protein
MSRDDELKRNARRTRQDTADRQAGRPVRRKRRRLTPFGILLYILFILGVSGLLAGLGWVTANDVLALNKGDHTAIITITDGEDFNKVVDTLKSEGIIEYKFAFRVFSALSGAKNKIASGTYALNTEMDYSAIIHNMSSASASRQQTTVTIPEGYTVEQIFELLEEKGVSSAEKLSDMAASHDYAFSFLQDIPLGEAARLEGYLFPDTYNFYLGEDPLYVINKMLVNFDARLTDSLRQEISDGGKTIREIIIIASMIEKETDGTDQARIASVIFNRLNNPTGETAGFLNIDATIQYVLPAGKIVTQEDYSGVDSPYNTYLYKGLPPGPISNPGMTAIRAAMYPESTGYYYYALGNDKLHHFFKTYASFQEFLASLGNG